MELWFSEYIINFYLYIIFKKFNNLTWCCRELSLTLLLGWKVPSLPREDFQRLWYKLNGSELLTGLSLALSHYNVIGKVSMEYVMVKKIFECSKDFQNFRNLWTLNKKITL